LETVAYWIVADTGNNTLVKAGARTDLAPGRSDLHVLSSTV